MTPPCPNPSSSAFTDILRHVDGAITVATNGYIRSQHINAEAALRKTRDALIAVFEQMDDAYLRTRRDDVAHVCARIQRVLMRSERQLPQKAHNDPFVMVADDITPADINLLSQLHVAAFAHDYGPPPPPPAIPAPSPPHPATLRLPPTP